MAFDVHSLTPDERDELRKELKDVDAELAALWEDPAYRKEIAAEMTEEVFQGFLHENLVDMFTETERVGFDDRVFINETRGLKAHWVARGGDIESSTIRTDRMELSRDTIGFALTEHTDKLRTSFSATQAQLIDLGQQRLQAEINKRVVSLLQAGIPTTHASYVSVSDLSSSLTALNTAIREVKDAAGTSAHVQPTNLAIIGRSTMTEQIVDALTADGTNTGFIPETNESLLDQGVLGRYRGARIITLTNYQDDNDVSFFPGNELYVLPRGAVRGAFYGSGMFKEREDDNWYWHYRTRLDVGFNFILPGVVRRVVDSTVTA